MFEGSVTLRAEVSGTGKFFGPIDVAPPAGADKVTLDSLDGTSIRCVVHVKSVADGPSGVAIALSVGKTVLDRLAFGYRLAIGSAMPIECSLREVGGTEPLSFGFQDFVKLQESLAVSVTAQPSEIKALIEAKAPSGEKNYGLFRSALISISPVERFMHLYNILLMIFNDKQKSLDAFIVAEEPKFKQTPYRKPGAKKDTSETVFTRLRNEFAHTRAGVDMDKTKEEMELRWEQLRDLTQKAIEKHP